MREYELMYIVRPDVDDAGLAAAMDSVKTLVENAGGELLKTTVWGKRRLAYTVKHMRDGYYVIVRINLPVDKVVNLERGLRIHDTVFRHLLVTTDHVAELPESGIAAPAVSAEEGDSDDDNDEDDNDEESLEELEAVAVGAEEGV